MTTKQKASTVGAIVVAIGGILFLASKLNLLSVKVPKEHTVVVDEAQAARLEEVDNFIEPGTPDEVEDMARRLVDQAFSAQELAQSDSGQSLPNAEQLRQLIMSRLLLMYNPSYKDYVEQIGELLGGDGHAALAGSMFEDETLWYAHANRYRYTGVAVDAARATLDFDSVSMGKGRMGGRQSTFTDIKVYGSAELANNGQPVFSIEVPVMLPPENTPDAKIMVLFATMSFVWDPSRHKWLPYRTALYDPTGSLGPIPPLWM